IEEQIKAGRIELELVPQGTLAERVRAGGAGIPAFYTPTGAGTLVAEGKERRTFGGREYVLETALSADYAVVRAQRADRHGNLGLGLPTLVSNHIDAARDIVLHSENGMLGFGPLAEERDEDVDLYNASGQLVSLLPGAAFFDSLYAHGMARGGRVTTVVLGAFQVSEKGDLANWNVPAS